MRVYFLTFIGLVAGFSLAQAATPIMNGSLSEGSATSITVEVETIPSTVPETVDDKAWAIIIDVEAARKHLADKIATSTSDVTVPTIATSVTELQEYAEFFTGANLAIKSLMINAEEIQLGYELPAKLLFVIPIRYTATVTIDREGYLKDFATPGWLAFIQDQAGATKTSVNTVLEKLVSALAESTEPQPSLYLLKQKQLSVVLAALRPLGK